MIAQDRLQAILGGKLGRIFAIFGTFLLFSAVSAVAQQSKLYANLHQHKAREQALRLQEKRSARRKLRRLQQQKLAQRIFQSPRSILAQGDTFVLRYRGLLPIESLTIVPEAPPDWAFAGFTLRSNLGNLTAPGLLELKLTQLKFPPGPFRDPFSVFEIYQELKHGLGWSQLLPTRRDPETRRLHVHRDSWGTGRFALAWRLNQPVNLLEVFHSEKSSGPEVIFVHGVDGTRSDYWGTRDVLASLTCFASRIWYFQYPSGAPIPQNAKALVREAREKFLPSDKQRILVGYSMGGLVSRYALEQLGSHLPVERLVLLATPNRGAEWAQILGKLPGLAHWGSLVAETWPGVVDMIPDSPFLLRLNDLHQPLPKTPTLALAGVVDTNGDLIVDRDSVHLPLHRRPKDYRFRFRKDFLNLDRLSHWGAHQEFAVNGFSDDLREWLALDQKDCREPKPGAHPLATSFLTRLRLRHAKNASGQR